jgi:hypothetical protein
MMNNGTLEYIEKTSDGWLAFTLKGAGFVRGIMVFETFDDALDLSCDNGWAVVVDDAYKEITEPGN